MRIFKIIEPTTQVVPFVLSIPHCGTGIPDNLSALYQKSQLENLDDTDWFLDELYDFAPSLGITTIVPYYSRWVIDLNREPNNKSLYSDGRIITSLCPTTNFLGEDIYKRDYVLNQQEIEIRLTHYFNPYHNKINELLKDFKSKFNQAFFWDAHSIRRHVPSIQKKPFPDLIIGDNDSTSCDTKFTKITENELMKSGLQVNYNHPFKGGYLTRSKGNPSQHIHAIQLEMCKDLYMNHNETKYEEKKAVKIKKILKNTFQHLIESLI